MSSPLPGPPTPDGSLTTQASVRESSPAFAHRFHSFSTRVFLVHRGRFAERLGPLRARLAHPRGVLRALVEGNPPFRLPERLVTERMVERGLARVDFLGTAPGMWSLHPPYRNEAFYERLPELIASVEAGRVPDAQRGDYDMNDSMVDWSDARAAVRRNRWRAPLARLLR